MPLNPRLLLLVIVVILLIANYDSSSLSPSSRLLLKETLRKETEALAILNHTSHGSFKPSDGRWLNLTGFRREDGYAWSLHDRVRARAKEQVLNALGEADAEAALSGQLQEAIPFYRNVSGYVRGQWVRSPLQKDVVAPILNLTALLPNLQFPHGEQFQRNISGAGGRLLVSLTEKTTTNSAFEGKAQRIKAEVSIADDLSTGDGWEVTMFGEHIVDSGHILLATSSDKFAGLFGLPHLQLSERFFNISQRQLSETIEWTMREQKAQRLMSLSPWSSQPNGAESDFARPSCEMVMYLQLHPLQLPSSTIPTRLPVSSIEPLERELRYPQGYKTLQPPYMVMSALIFSPDCGFILESKGPPLFAVQEGNHLKGVKREVHAAAGRRYIVFFAMSLVAELLLMIQQMKEASTPSTRSRISFHTIWLLSLGDGFACMGLLPLALIIPHGAMLLLGAAAVSLFALTFFDLRFMMDIWTIQTRERPRRIRRQTTAEADGAAQGDAVPQPRVDNQAANASLLPLPATARNNLRAGATPIILPPDQDDNNTEGAVGVVESEAADMRRDLSALYAKFFLILFGTVFLSVNTLSWYPFPRSLYANFFALLYLSFWVPQIYRNVMRNCRKALLYRFVAGQSLLRFLPFVYFYTVQDNIMFTETDPTALLVLAGWLWVQCCVLVLQDLFGPRLFVPEKWVPPVYDYHPILRGDEEDSRMPIGFTQALQNSDEGQSPSLGRKPSNTRVDGKSVFDCAICMQDIEVPVVASSSAQDVSSSSATAGNFLARRNYMITPCRHIFHTPCLEAAMKHRLQCPICRDPLPPL